MFLLHPFSTIFNKRSYILLLGTFPSQASRSYGFYYGHPKNRFWDVLSNIFDEEVPDNKKDKKQYLLRHKVALYDAIKACKIEGSSDKAIHEIVPTNLSTILDSSIVKHIYTNGSKAYNIVKKYYPEVVKQYHLTALPSTSPANARYSMERLLESWYSVKKALDARWIKKDSDGGW